MDIEAHRKQYLAEIAQGRPPKPIAAYVAGFRTANHGSSGSTITVSTEDISPGRRYFPSTQTARFRVP
jgi:hypothetical protein